MKTFTVQLEAEMVLTDDEVAELIEDEGERAGEVLALGVRGLVNDEIEDFIRPLTSLLRISVVSVEESTE